MKSRPFIAALLLSPLCHADTVLLLDGTQLDGKLIREDAEYCTIEVKVTRTIRDEQVIPKAKIKKIIKDGPDIAAFAAIADAANTPELLPLKEYDARIASVEKYLTSYPDGSKRAEAKKILGALQPERDAISTGSIKFGGRIISASEREGDAYDIDAKIMASQVAQLAQSGQIIPALRKFAEFEHDFSGSAVFNAAIPYHLSMIKSLFARVSAAADAQPALVKERESGFSRMPDADRNRALQIVKDEAAEYANRIAAERSAKEKWLSIDPFQKEILTDTARNLDQEARRLENYKPSSSNGSGATEPGELFRNAWKLATTSSDEKAIAAAIQAAQTAKLPERYLNKLKQAAYSSANSR